MLAETNSPEETADTASDEPAGARKRARRPPPAALPRDVIEHAAPRSCPGCGGVLRPLGEDVTTRGRISGRSDLAAIRYSLSRWNALTLILHDGRGCIDNSAAERTIRPVALGRRNWTFAGSDAGGERAACIYSLIETGKLNGLDPEAYLRHTLERIADHPVIRVGGLLPWKMRDIKPRLDQRLAA